MKGFATLEGLQLCSMETEDVVTLRAELQLCFLESVFFFTFRGAPNYRRGRSWDWPEVWEEDKIIPRQNGLPLQM